MTDYEPQVDALGPLIKEQTHAHSFVIPVEFENYNAVPLYDGSGHVTIAFTKQRVTKLRCACGKEQARA